MGSSKRPEIYAPANVAALCGHARSGCHGWTELNRTEAKAAGWLVSGWRDSAATPVTLHDGRRVLLGETYTDVDEGAA